LGSGQPHLQWFISLLESFFSRDPTKTFLLRLLFLPLPFKAKARDIIKKESGVELLMSAAKNHPDVENIQKYVTEAISAISEGEKDSDDEDAKKSPPPVSSDPKPANLAIIRKGFLTKQGGMIKTWKKRWFVLDSSKLTYFKGNEVCYFSTFPSSLRLRP